MVITATISRDLHYYLIEREPPSEIIAFWSNRSGVLCSCMRNKLSVLKGQRDFEEEHRNCFLEGFIHFALVFKTDKSWQIVSNLRSDVLSWRFWWKDKGNKPDAGLRVTNKLALWFEGEWSATQHITQHISSISQATQSHVCKDTHTPSVSHHDITQWSRLCWLNRVWNHSESQCMQSGSSHAQTQNAGSSPSQEPRLTGV